MADLIDRDALLDGLEELFKRRELNAACTGNRGSTVTWNDAICAIKDAPTASDWDRYSTKLWKEAYERGRQDGVAKDTNVPSTDCISRREAIDALRKEMPGGCSGKAEYIIEQLPAAQPQSGRWEMKTDPYGFFDEIPVCSECGCTTKMREVYKFCPNCGAKMTEG